MKGANFKTDGKNPDVSFSTDFMLEAKYIALEQAVSKIVTEGTESLFTRDWMDNLSVDDGNTLYHAVEELSGKKK